MLLFNDFVVIDDKYLWRSENRIAGINNLKTPPQARFCTGATKMPRRADQQAQAKRGYLQRGRLLFGGEVQYPAQNKKVRSGSYTTKMVRFRSTLPYCGVQRQQRIKARRAVSSRQRENSKQLPANDAEQRFLVRGAGSARATATGR